MKNILKISFKLYLQLIFVWFTSIILMISFSALTLSLPKWVFLVVLQTFTILILITVISNKMYHIGFKDSNNVKIGRMKEDLLLGFKVGLITQIPSLILLIVSVILNLKFAIYMLLNVEYYSLLTLIAGKSSTMQMPPLKIFLFVLLLFIVPVISCISYILGYKGIDIIGKLTYKKRR